MLPVLQCIPVSCERDGLCTHDRDTCKSSSGKAVSIGTLCWQNMHRQFVLSWCTFELYYWPARSFSRVPRRDASLLLSVGSSTLLAYALCDALARCHHFWVDMTSQGVIDLYHFLCGRTNWCSIIAITPYVGVWSFRQEAWRPCLVLVLDHLNVKWWWRFCD